MLLLVRSGVPTPLARLGDRRGSRLDRLTGCPRPHLQAKNETGRGWVEGLVFEVIDKC